MFTLLAVGREVSNSELREIVGFAIDGKLLTELNGLGLVHTDKGSRPFVHILTDEGKAWCREEIKKREVPSPPPRSTLVRAMYVFFGGLDDYLSRERLELADLFTASVELTEVEITNRIRSAYRKLAKSPRDWVGLVDLRPMLGDASRQDVDAVLKELSRTGQVHLVPMSNRKALTQADHDAAIRIGGDDNHRLSIEVS
ncbi:hypothetical protein [Kibdelosporangium aridum]|uniref:hypothetical protein n=1 Tax=Kibdelosporangium aridum TaxID=2030 RepID=UPI0035E9ED8F